MGVLRRKRDTSTRFVLVESEIEGSGFGAFLFAEKFALLILGDIRLLFEADNSSRSEKISDETEYMRKFNRFEVELKGVCRSGFDALFNHFGKIGESRAKPANVCAAPNHHSINHGIGSNAAVLHLQEIIGGGSHAASTRIDFNEMAKSEQVGLDVVFLED